MTLLQKGKNALVAILALPHGLKAMDGIIAKVQY